MHLLHIVSNVRMRYNTHTQYDDSMSGALEICVFCTQFALQDSKAHLYCTSILSDSERLSYQCLNFKVKKSASRSNSISLACKVASIMVYLLTHLSYISKRHILGIY